MYHCESNRRLHKSILHTLTIADTGPPIPEKDLELIWNSFYQADTQRSGSGLGLAIVKSIVDMHGGRCRAYIDHNANCFEIIL